MKLVYLISFLFLSCSKFEAVKHPANPLKLLPQGGSEIKNLNLITESADQKKLQPILDLGARAVKWLNLVNEKRDVNHRLNLADRSTQFGVSPENPKVISTNLILEKFTERVNQIPNEMKDYIFNNKELTSQPPVSDEDFIKSIRALNGSYQNTIRWLGQVQYLDYYAANDVYDIRGIYFLKKEKDLENKLNHFNDLDQVTQLNYQNWLVSICHNSGQDKETCRAMLTESKPLAFYKKYVSEAEQTYNNFFSVDKIREDLLWNKEKSVLTQDFTNPQNSKVAAWLKTNVEEEWQLQGFQLLVRFVEKNEISPFIDFVKGVVPNVSGESRNVITMDPDYSLDDYDTQWTIRHEFGHILGFPDCYLEFYDSEKKEMNYYTIEPENLMCAWGGKLQPKHAEELKRVY